MDWKFKEYLSIGYLSSDATGHIIEINRIWLRKLGYRRQEVIGRPVRSFLAAESQTAFQTAFPRLIRNGKLINQERTFIKKDGAALIAVLDAKVEFDNQHKCIRTHCFLKDITETNKLHDKLYAKKQSLTHLIESVTDHVYVTHIDHNGQITNKYISPNVEEIAQYSYKLFLKNWSIWHDRLVVLQDQFTAKQQFQKLKQGISCECEYRIKRKDQQVRWVRDRAKAIKNRDGSVDIFGLISDITKRKETEISLKESEARYRDIFDHSTLGIYQSTISGQFLHINKAAAKMFGFRTQQEILSKITNIAQQLYVSPKDRKLTIEKVPNGGSGIFEVEFKKRDGSHFFVRDYMRKVVDENGKLRYIEGFIEDITQQKKFEILHKTSADIFKNIPSGMFVYRYHKPDKLYLEGGNKAAEKLSNLKIKNWVGKEFNQLWPNAQESGITKAYLKVMQSGKPYATEDLYYHDTMVQGAFKLIAFRLPEDRLAVAFENITDRKKQEAQLKHLSHQIITAHEDEKQLISRELHDSLAQHLAFLKIQVQSFQSVVGENNQDINAMVTIVHNMLDQTRNLIEDLRPSILYDLGLEAAINSMAATITKRHKVQTIVDLPDFDKLVTRENEIHIYRIIQEGLQNAIKHAHAKKVIISHIHHPKDIELYIKDDGKGFDIHHLNHDKTGYTHLGLPIMKERAASANAQLRIDSIPKKGTVVTLTLTKRK